MATRRLARFFGLTLSTRAAHRAPVRPRRSPPVQRPADDAQRPSLEAELARLDGRAV